MSDNPEQIEDAVWGDWGRSMYNNNDGIRITFTFFHLPLPGVKLRANGRPPRINKLYNGSPDPAVNSFTILYDIQGTSTKDISLADRRDFTTMVEAVKRRPKPALNVYLTELQLPEEEDEPQDEPDDNLDDEQPVNNDDQPGGGDPSDEEEINVRASKRQKGKKNPVSEEEEDQYEKVIQLQAATKCNDSQCNNYTNHCIPIGPNADHLPLLPKHFHVWSSAWSSGIDGVDEHNPPNNRIFDLSQQTTSDTTDINLLASRRVQQIRQTTSNGSVNISLTGLAEAFVEMRKSASPEAFTIPSPILHNSPIPPPLPPKMTLHDFIVAHDLSPIIHQKLDLDIAGPHTL
ncbi:hypothetical protein C8J56DRAFT_898438 [Mycena floridula]|nr:hypothetical protein C8J56DRAFT_898438 [Mycena floridula]